MLELDDATKILNDKYGNPVNYGEMSLDQFLQAREYIDSGQIEKILEMNWYNISSNTFKLFNMILILNFINIFKA